MNQAVQLTVLW